MSVTPAVIYDNHTVHLQGTHLSH